ncbi:DUF2125 domain-containing protein [Marinibacterium profundimaris]|uniref:DUF2125 domain-containing protein n=1 Tax=Marinibacterium profundimaris TaxID=1679460 RepID=A0A225NDP8_9RHOB|nr:DUF2125 domain-containing protein [Marinibacterium profundimaris]OWU70351.1 hypothetical protein ATO3_20390 [Marinibacterium profundimaris]
MRLIRVLVGLAVLWCLVWGGTAFVLRQAITGWFDARIAEGWQADYAEISTGGFPLRHVTVLREPALADPGTGRAWSADAISLDSPAVWPGRQSLRFADTPQYISYFDNTSVLTAADMVADLDLAVGLALQLRSMGLSAGPWSLEAAERPVASGAGLTMAMVQDEAVAETYGILLDIPDFAPGPRLRGLMGGAESLPDTFGALAMDMDVRFDRPWDRRALDERRPQPQRIDLRLAEVAWGPLRISAAGGFDVDAEGVPEGQITIRAENWREMLRMAEAAGALPPAAAQSAERALGFLAGLGGNAGALDVQLNVTGGVVALGPIPLGPAPRLILR